MSITYWFISILIFILTFNSHAETWQAGLADGGKAQADLQTRKPVVNLDGNSTQLWDGVHTLEDGSVVIVRDGVVVPNEAMYRAWSAANSQPTELELNECAVLTRRVCGFKNSCSDKKACGLAQQLQRLWENAPDTANGLSVTGKSECHKALADAAAFPPCAKEAKPPVACARLVTQACGNKEECKSKAACDAARQLLKLAQEAAVKNVDNETGPEQYCYEAMNNHFFATCQQTP